MGESGIRLDWPSSQVAVMVPGGANGGNRITSSFIAELEAACRQIVDAADARAVVVASAGRAFSPSWDEAGLAEDPLELVDAVNGFGALARLPVPTIAAVEGEAIGAGAELALACDIRIVGAGATFQFPDVGQGRIPMAGGTQRLPRLVGRAKALELVLWGEAVSAAEAERIGLVNRAVPEGGALEAALQLARTIAAAGPLGVRFAKEAILRGIELPLEQALRLETDLTAILQTTADRAEGVRAFLEKRRPEFRGE